MQHHLRYRPAHPGTQAVLALVLAFLAFIGVGVVSCVRPPNIQNPTTPKTPLQWTIVYNAALAKGNDAFAQSVISLQKQRVITPAQAKPLLVVSQKIATTGTAILAITRSNQPWPAAAQQISALLTTLGADKLLTEAGITNAQVTAAFQSVVAVVVLIQNEVKAQP